MVKDFTNQAVMKVVEVDLLCFGRVKEQTLRGNWLWLNVDWSTSPDLVKISNWQRCDNIKIINPEEMIHELESL